MSSPSERLTAQIANKSTNGFALVEVADVHSVLDELSDAHVALSLCQSMLKVVRSLVTSALPPTPTPDNPADPNVSIPGYTWL